MRAAISSACAGQRYHSSAAARRRGGARVSSAQPTTTGTPRRVRLLDARRAARRIAGRDAARARTPATSPSRRSASSSGRRDLDAPAVEQRRPRRATGGVVGVGEEDRRRSRAVRGESRGQTRLRRGSHRRGFAAPSRRASADRRASRRSRRRRVCSASRLSSHSSSAVTMMMRTVRPSVGCCFMMRHTSHPSRPGIITSSSTSAGFTVSNTRERLVAVVRDRDRIPADLQILPDDLGVVVIVVDHENRRKCRITSVHWTRSRVYCMAGPIGGPPPREAIRVPTAGCIEIYGRFAPNGCLSRRVRIERETGRPQGRPVPHEIAARLELRSVLRHDPHLVVDDLQEAALDREPCPRCRRRRAAARPCRAASSSARAR